MSTLTVYLLGRFEVHHGDQLITPHQWRSRQNRTILKILLTERGHVVTSDQLIDILWPDDDPDASRRRLHVRISQLRRVLDPDDPDAYVLTVEGGYTLNPEADCWIDVAEFEAHARRGRRCQKRGELAEAITAYETARNLYRGDFLEEDLYVDWAFAERERLWERFLTALTELAECYAQQGRYRRAIARCHQVLAADPYREAVYARLMLYHYYAGEQVQALRTYERCRRVLADELGVEPLPMTVAMAERIQDGTLWAEADAPRYPPPAYEGRLFEVPYSLGHVPFVGRECEYAWLVERWRDLNTDVLLVEGEAGVGKSRLVDEFLGYATTEGATILRSRATAGEELPYAPMVAALRSLPEMGDWKGLSSTTLAALAPLFPKVREQYPDLPSIPKLSAQHERERFFEAVESLIRARVPAGSLLYVDDAHRADAASLSLLARLAGYLTVVLTCRSEETLPSHPLHAALRPLHRQGRVAKLTLEWLPPAAVRTLIRQLAGADLPALTEQVIAQASGNPLFVVASLQHMFEEGTLYIDVVGRWATVGDVVLSLPPTIRETIEARLRRLSHDQRQVFDLAAVTGGEFDFALLRHATQMEDDPLLDMLDALLEANLLVEPRAVGRGEFAVTHDRYAEVAYETLPRVRRRRLHRRVAEALEATVPDVAEVAPELARHFRSAGDAERAFGYFILAGDEAHGRYAGDEARHYYRQALALPNLLPAQRAAAHERIGDVHYHALETQAAVEAYDEALHAWQAVKDAEPLIGARLYRKIAELCTRWAGEHPQAREYIERGLALLPQGRMDQERARLQVAQAFDAFFLRSPKDLQAARQSAEAALALAEQLGAWTQVSQALDALAAIVAETTGNVAEVLAFHGRRLEIVDRISDPFERIDVYKMMGWALFNDASDYVGGIAHLERSLRLAQAVGSTGAQRAILALLVQAHLQWGRWWETVRWARVYLDLDSHTVTAAAVHVRLSTALIWLGQEQKAEAHLATALAAEGRPDSYEMANRSQALLEHYIAREMWQAGKECAEAALAVAKRTVLDWLLAAECYAHLGDADRASVLLERSQSEGSPRWEARICRVRGLCAQIQGDWSDSEAELRAALETFRTLDCRGEVIRTLCDLAALYTAMGDKAATWACREQANAIRRQGQVRPRAPPL